MCEGRPRGPCEGTEDFVVEDHGAFKSAEGPSTGPGRTAIALVAPVRHLNDKNNPGPLALRLTRRWV